MAHKTKVILSIHDLGTGGSEKVVVREANLLYARGYEVAVVTMMARQRNDLASDLRIPKENFVSFYFRSHFDLGEYFKLVKFLWKWKPDIIISASLFTNTIFKMAKLFYYAPLIIREGNVFVRHGKLSKFFDRFTHKMVRRYFCNALAIKHELENDIGIPSGKIEVIYNGIDKEILSSPYKSREEIRKELGIAMEDFVVLNVGSMSTAQKGQEYLIRAFAKIEEKGKARLIFAGDGHRKNRLLEECLRLGIQEKVLFLGKRADLAEIRSASDIFVFPSLWEGMPNALLDAMMSGMPIVTTSVGGIPEVLRDNVSALFTIPKSVESLIECMTRLVEDENLRDILGENAARAAHREDLTWEYHGNKLESLIKVSLRKDIK